MNKVQAPQDDLLARAQQGATVLTVNKRLARYLRQGYDRRMQQQGHNAWPAPAIRSFDGWQRHMAGRLGLTGRLLGHAQAVRLWERVITDDLREAGGSLMRVPEAAEQACRAHNLLQNYGVSFDAIEGGADHRAFLRWQQRWQTVCDAGNWQDPARLPQRLAESIAAGQGTPPEDIWLAGYDEHTPAVKAMVAALEARGCKVRDWQPVSRRPRRTARVACLDMEDEVRRCARWARTLLEQGAQSIGIVAVDLTAYQQSVQRILREELAPASLLPSGLEDRAFNLSLGTRLADEGMVAAALELLGAGPRVGLDAISFLLRSPFVWGHLAESHGRAVFDRELRDLRLAELPLKKLIRRARSGFKKGRGRCDIFAQVMDTVHAGLDEQRPRLPGAWARHFARVLDACRWPGDRALDSRDYQVFHAWKELLARLAAFDSVSEPISRQEALALLRRQAATEIFQPEGSEGRVQVMGVLEAAGLEFEALWLLGMHEEALPAPVRPNPFVPLQLQRRCGMPHADAERELAYAGLLAERLLTAADQVWVSCPGQTEGRALQPSPLVRHVPLDDPPLADTRPPAVLIGRAREQGPLESWSDGQGRPLAPGRRITGGTAILKDQALCPFRAYARHRLGAVGLAASRPGLDGLARGVLVHDALEYFWNETRSGQALRQLSAEARAARVDESIERALTRLEQERHVPVPAALRRLEAQRLAALLIEWLDMEAQRPPFEVECLEMWHRENLGQLTIQTRIDRIDRLPGHGRVIIDYKTGRPAVRDWLGERPVEPQLPLYGLGRGKGELAAVAFARVRRGACAFLGLGSDADLLPGVTLVNERHVPDASRDNWQELLQLWRASLQRLAREFAAGEARVDPVNPSQACDRCDLQALCRIAEQHLAFVAEDVP